MAIEDEPRDGLHNSGIDHPCKNTCSGWKQGYLRGYDIGQEIILRHQAAKILKLQAENMKLRDFLEELRFYVSDIEKIVGPS